MEVFFGFKLPAPLSSSTTYNVHVSDYIASQQRTCGELPSDDAYPALSRKRMIARISGRKRCEMAHVPEQATKDTQ
jgi:hypothetical protein